MAKFLEFEITVSGDIGLIIFEVEKKIKETGGTFIGNRESGKFSGKYTEAGGGTIVGSYVVNGDKVMITIDSVTGAARFSKGKVEKAIRDYFKQ
jgi:hypothetical protein